MKSRYFLAIAMSPEIVSELKVFYKNNFSKELPVKNIHLTLVAPFFTREESGEEEMVKTVKEIRIYPFMAKFTKLDFFEQKSRKILYIKVEPEIEFRELAQKCEMALKELINKDVGPYSSGMVPSFKAHVTLDYDFREIIPDSFPVLSFMVEKMVVFKEENGIWCAI